jgi:hypothetical protein
MKEDEWAPHKGSGGTHHHTEGGQRQVRRASWQIVVFARRRPAYGVWRRPAYGARFRAAFSSYVEGQSQAGEAVLQGVDEGPRQWKCGVTQILVWYRYGNSCSVCKFKNR